MMEEFPSGLTAAAALFPDDRLFDVKDGRVSTGLETRRGSAWLPDLDEVLGELFLNPCLADSLCVFPGNVGLDGFDDGAKDDGFDGFLTNGASPDAPCLITFMLSKKQKNALRKTTRQKQTHAQRDELLKIAHVRGYKLSACAVHCHRCKSYKLRWVQPSTSWTYRPTIEVLEIIEWKLINPPQAPLCPLPPTYMIRNNMSCEDCSLHKG